MKGIGTTGLCFWLGCLAVHASAQEVQWRSAAKPAMVARPGTTQPVAALDRPITPTTPPKSLGASTVVDPHVTPASYQVPGLVSLRPAIRMQSPDADPLMPEPSWPEDGEQKPTKDAVRDSTSVQEEISPPPMPSFPSSIPSPIETPAPDPVPIVTTDMPMEPGVISCDGPPCRVPRLYGNAEYLLWWLRSSTTPPLATTSPEASQGIIGLPGTVVLFGGRGAIDHQERSGGRFTLGYWLDPCQRWGLESTFFFLGERASKVNFDSENVPLIARPFFDLNNNQEFSQIVAAPGRSVGSLSVVAPSQLWGIDANLRRSLWTGCCCRIDLIGGFRYLDLHEGLQITEQGTVLPTVQPFGGTQFVVFDNFDTRNQFYGGQMGLSTELRRGRFFVNMRGLVALGSTHQTVSVAGGQVLTAPNGAVSTFQGGLLALPSNIGHFTRDHFSVVPEAGVNIGYNVTENLRAYVGYTFLYWTNVVRPGEQIDRVIDINQIPNFIPGPPANQVRPLVPFRQTDFWAQGLNFGLEMRY